MNELSVYLSKATALLFDYQWIYNFRATHILVNGIFSNIPEVWVQALLCLSDDDLNLLTAGVAKDGWPTCLLEFISKYHELVLPSASADQLSPSTNWEQIPDKLRKGMSPKKQHEVVHLASFIYQQCNYSQLSRILDVGSGLGYLGKLLHHKSGYHVLGLEADAGHVVRAVKMQQPICSAGVNHMALTLNPAHKKEVWKVTVEDVRHALEDQNNWVRKCSCGQVHEDSDSPGSTEKSRPKSSGLESGSPSKLQTIDSRVCMVSLHSCGDLSTTAIRLFLKLPETRLLILLSCCYHKMKTQESPSHSQVLENPSSSSGRVRSSSRDNKKGYQEKEMGKTEIDCSDLQHLKMDGHSEKSGNHAVKDPVDDSCGRVAALTLQDELREESKHCKHESKVRNPSQVEESFPDFPMSKLLKGLVTSSQEFLKRPLLRLASEITVEMWHLMTPAQHDEHAIHVMGRAVLELYALKAGYRLKKKRRKGLRKIQVADFREYFGDALKRFELHPNSEPKVIQTTYPGKEDCHSHSPVSTVHFKTEAVHAKTLNISSNVEKYHEVQTSSQCVPSNCENGREKTSEHSYVVGAFSVDDNIPYVDEKDDELTVRRYSEHPDIVLSERSEIGSFDQEVSRSPSHMRQVVIDQSTSTQFESHLAKLTELAQTLCTQKTMHLTKAVYALQAAIQSVAEGYILADRLVFLLEEGGRSVNASLVQIFDRSLSPRSLAIVARKCDSL